MQNQTFNSSKIKKIKLDKENLNIFECNMFQISNRPPFHSLHQMIYY